MIHLIVFTLFKIEYVYVCVGRDKRQDNVPIQSKIV